MLQNANHKLPHCPEAYTVLTQGFCLLIWLKHRFVITLKNLSDQLSDFPSDFFTSCNFIFACRCPIVPLYLQQLLYANSAVMWKISSWFPRHHFLTYRYLTHTKSFAGRIWCLLKRQNISLVRRCAPFHSDSQDAAVPMAISTLIFWSYCSF